jgi:hypothetical protein
MVLRSPCWILIPYLAVVLPAPSARAGSDPSVTLEVRNLTAAEAAEALGKVAGWKIAIRSDAPAPAAPSRREPRFSFRWSGATFSTALREFCARTSLRPASTSIGGAVRQIELWPGRYPLDPPWDPRTGFEKDGIRLRVRAVSVTHHDAAGPFVAARAPGSRASVTLSIIADLHGRDPATLAGFTTVRARDDRGASSPEIEHAAFYGNTGSMYAFPDQWTGSIQVPGVSSNARKLDWVDADLIAYRPRIVRSIELPWPAAGKTEKKPWGDATVFVGETAGEPGTVLPEETDPELRGLSKNTGLDGTRRRLFLRVYTPAAGEPNPDLSGARRVTVIGQAGTRYETEAEESAEFGTGDWHAWQARISVRGVKDPPVRILLERLEPAERERLFTVRFTNVPLPERIGVPVEGYGPPGPRPTSPSSSRQPGGGTLVGTTSINGRPASAGWVWLGLTRLDGAVPGPTDWRSVEANALGQVRLAEIAPGRYRVIRVFRLRHQRSDTGTASTATALEGSWTGAEQTVIIEAGKTTELPPLQWSPAGPGGSSGTAGPARPPANPGTRTPARTLRGRQ